MKMLERIARAMVSCSGQNPDEPVAGSAGVSSAGFVYSAVYRRAWEDKLGEAAAALTALLEPNEAMAAAGADNLFGSSSDDWSDDARAVWSAMVQAALDEKEG
jgi:hypothetical protein